MARVNIPLEYQRRQCVIEETADGPLVSVRWDHNRMKLGVLSTYSVDAAKRYCEAVQIGGATEWTSQQAAGHPRVWYSETVLTDTTGRRLTPAELSHVRKGAR